MPDANVEGEQQGFNRLTLVKKMAVGAFAVPAIVSFQLDSLARAGTFSKGKHGCDHSHPNQSVGNQSEPPPEHSHPNQTYDNQSEPPPDHTYGNQTSGGGRDNKDCDHKPGHQYPNQTASNQ